MFVQVCLELILKFDAIQWNNKFVGSIDWIVCGDLKVLVVLFCGCGIRELKKVIISGKIGQLNTNMFLVKRYKALIRVFIT